MNEKETLLEQLPTKSESFSQKRTLPDCPTSLNMVHPQVSIYTHLRVKKLPNLGPLGFFIHRLVAVVKASFVLIPHRNVVFHSIPQLGDDASGREAGRRVGPGLMGENCLFVCHTSN